MYIVLDSRAAGLAKRPQNPKFELPSVQVLVHSHGSFIPSQFSLVDVITQT